MITTELCLQKYVDDYSFRLDEKTLYGYKLAVRQLVNHCMKSFEQINPRDIRNWMAYLIETDKKPSTMQWIWSGLNMFYQYCLEEGLVTSNPMESIAYPTKEDSLPHYLEVNQIVELRKLLEGNVEEQALMEVFYSTGVRLSELIAMKIEDITWSERMILIPKGKYNQARIVLFTRLCAEYLQKYLQERSDNLPFLFLNKSGKGQINRPIIYDRFKMYREKLGFYFSPHTLRHSFAAHLAQKGMPLEGIQALLGHEKPKNTKIYSRLFEHARKDMYDEWM